MPDMQVELISRPPVHSRNRGLNGEKSRLLLLLMLLLAQIGCAVHEHEPSKGRIGLPGFGIDPSIPIGVDFRCVSVTLSGSRLALRFRFANFSKRPIKIPVTDLRLASEEAVVHVSQPYFEIREGKSRWVPYFENYACESRPCLELPTGAYVEIYTDSPLRAWPESAEFRMLFSGHYSIPAKLTDFELRQP